VRNEERNVMDVKARCGCGAELELSPRNPMGHHDYSRDKDEREAVAAAFREWTQAHARCGRPEPLNIGGYPDGTVLSGRVD
jgi:hypothetical protein